jgi:hypothetical protein
MSRGDEDALVVSGAGFGKNDVCNIGQSAAGSTSEPYLCSHKKQSRTRACRKNKVVWMDDPRYTIAAIEIDDVRCGSLLRGVAVEMEDPRCRNLNNRLVLEMEDPRCSPVAMKMEDPRCGNLFMAM